MSHAASPAVTGFAASRPLRNPGLLARVVAWTAIRRSRLSLVDLDDHLLRDVGLTRAQAREEAALPSWETIWDAPAHWLR